MKIIYIHTSNKQIAKTMLIKTAIKANMRYVEMEDEVLIEDNTLVRIKEKKDIIINSDFLCFKTGKSDYIPNEEVSIQKQKPLPKVKKYEIKKQSIIVNRTLKFNQYYNKRRRYS